MPHRPADTSEEAWAIVQTGIARMTPAQRIRRVAELTCLTHQLALAGIRALYPNETDRQHRLRLAARYIPPELMRAAFGYEP